MPSASERDGQEAEPADGTAATVADGSEADEGMVSVPLYRVRRGTAVELMTTEPAPAPPPPPRPTVLARTLALAHRLQGMIDDGTAADRTEVAAQLGFTRARITQIMDLLLLAPDIQEEILFSVSLAGRDAITTRDVRQVVRVVAWAEQRRLWKALRRSCNAE